MYANSLCKNSLSLYFFPSFYSFVYLLYFPLSHLSEHTCIPPSLISFLSIWLSVVHAMFLFLSTKRHGGEALRPPPQTPLQLFAHNHIKNIFQSIHQSFNQSINLTICLFFNLFMYESRSNYGGRRCALPPTPSNFFHMFNDDPKNVYLYSSITHSMKHSMYLFVSLFDSLSFMQCSRFCPPNTTGGRRCTLPPNPPPVLTKIRMDSLLFNFFLIFLIFLWSSKF